MIILTTDQRTPEWHAARLGKLTGSRAADMMAKIQKGEAAARRNLRCQLVLERLTGISQDNDFVSKDMQHGIDAEGDAFAAYEAVTGHLVSRVGFVAHDTLPAGCSPDGQIENYAGLLELKCRKSANHLAFVRSRKVPYDAQWQILHNLWITGASWCDYASFDDRFPDPLQLVVVRVPRVVADLEAYELAARLFLGEVAHEIGEVEQLARAVVAA